MTTEHERARPPVVSAEEWQQEREALLLAEKDLTHQLDALAARRRRLPMVQFDPSYRFTGRDGEHTLLELFGDLDQLAVYQFMDRGPDAFCPGCTNFTRQVTALPVLAEEGVAWATVSDMPLTQIQQIVDREGWHDLAFYSSQGTTFSADCGAGGGFLLSLFLRDGDEVFRTYSTTTRGVDRVMFVPNILDLAVWGRQEEWEDSPPGWPQH